MRGRFVVVALSLGVLPVHAQEDPAAGGPVGFQGAIVHRVFWTGNRVTRDHVIAREFETRVGEPFGPYTRRQDSRRLQNLAIFARIEVVPTLVDGGVDLEFRVVEMPSYIAFAALSFTEENGWSIGPALSSVNLFGRDIAMSARVLCGGTTTFLLDLADPWMTGNHVSRDLHTAYMTRRDKVREFEETSWEVMPWFGTH